LKFVCRPLSLASVFRGETLLSSDSVPIAYCGLKGPSVFMIVLFVLPLGSLLLIFFFWFLGTEHRLLVLFFSLECDHGVRWLLSAPLAIETSEGCFCFGALLPPSAAWI